MIQIIIFSSDSQLHRVPSWAALRSEYKITVECDKERLREVLGACKADILILDLKFNYSSLPRQLAFYEEIKEYPIPVIVMIDDLRDSTTLEFMKRGAFACIRKPLSLGELKVVLQSAHPHVSMKADLEDMRHSMQFVQGCDGLIGTSGRAQVVYDLIQRVANLNAFVLINGESGTGKELVARAIHNLGNRAKQPFVAVSCGAIPESLIEAELFGHEKGAFTGSTGARMGYFEQAGQGTLFLDEIGELSQATQVKLLRVLQQKEFTRLGGNRLIPLKARVVFATHRDLEQMVEAGTFRRDLFFRVNVMTIPVPALRDRTEDIPILARHFIKRYAAEYEKAVADIRPDVLEMLVEHEWPGNIRELENIIQSAVIRADGESITEADLPEQLQHLSTADSVSSQCESDCFEDLLRHFKINVVKKAISECNGNKSLAAQKLGISRAYLHRLLNMGRLICVHSGSKTMSAA